MEVLVDDWLARFVMFGYEDFDGQVGSMNRFQVLFLMFLLIFQGCNRADPDRQPDGPRPSGDSLSAAVILQRMIKTYQAAESYQDQGVLSLSYRYANEPRKDVSQAAVCWSRPNRLALRAYQLTLTVDGDKLRARIVDESTGNIGNQLLVRHAGEELALADLYADSLVRDVLVGGRGGQPVQLELLLQEKPMAVFLGESVSREKMPEARIEGHRCYRIAIKSDDGRYELWIDRENYLLRRLVYPAGALVQDMLSDPQIRDVQLVAELRSAQLNPELAENDFLLRIPAGAKAVTHFVVPPQPLPTDLFGKRAGIFQFQGLPNGTVSRAELAGKVAVLMWFADHPSNRQTLGQLDQVAAQFKADPGVVFYAVCTEPSDVLDQQILELKKEWKLELPVLRDVEAYGRDVFRIPAAPTLVVLDGKGRLQMFEAGPNAQLGLHLPRRLKQLIGGTDLAAETLAGFVAEQEAYEQKLVQTHQASLTSTEVKPMSEPELFELKQIWSNSDGQQPVNPLLVKETDGSWHLDVLDRGHVLRLDSDGKTVKNFDLKLQEKRSVSYLRTAVDVKGHRWFAAGQMGGSRVHVFNGKWEKQFSFPSAGERHAGIEDFQLTDLDGDGLVELYLGYRGVVGLQQVSMKGARQWTYRGAESVLSLAVAETADQESKNLLLTTEAGVIHRLDPAGARDRQIEVPGVMSHHLFSAGFSTEQGAQFCAIMSTHNRLAVGLDRQLRKVWQYQLPPGAFSRDIRFVQSANLLGTEGGQWLIAAADGTIHIVSADGEFADQFATGRKLSGFTVGRLGDQVLLFLSDETAVTAWHVQRRTGLE